MKEIKPMKFRNAYAIQQELEITLTEEDIQDVIDDLAAIECCKPEELDPDWIEDAILEEASDRIYDEIKKMEKELKVTIDYDDCDLELVEE